jgi:phosphatidylserine synthase
LEVPLRDAAVNTTSVFSEGVYVGAGVAATATAVVVEITVVVGAGVETTVVVAGWIVTVVAGSIVVDCDVVQPATRTAKIRRQMILMNTEDMSFHRLCIIDQSFLSVFVR